MRIKPPRQHWDIIPPILLTPVLPPHYRRTQEYNFIIPIVSRQVQKTCEINTRSPYISVFDLVLVARKEEAFSDYAGDIAGFGAMEDNVELALFGAVGVFARFSYSADFISETGP
jgi:hypothetical protein